MAKYTEVSKDIQEKFDKVLESTTIPEYIAFKLLQTSTLKIPIKLFKGSDFIHYLSNIDIIVVVNEDILDQLKDTQIEILFDELLAQVYFDTEADKLVLLKPDFVSFTGIITKYGDELSKCKEVIKLLIQQREDDAKAEKEAKKNKKKK